MSMKKMLALLLAVTMILSMAACAPKDDTSAPDGTATPSTTVDKLVGVSGKYTYNDWTGALATSWNPHTYKTSDQSYPLGYTSAGFYDFIFNDAANPVEGKNPYEGYVIVPEMAASEPVDVTEKLKGEAKWGIPESATAGYAYTIDLNPLATWQDGTKITADDYVESMKRLLDPRLLNYRANGYYTGELILVGAEHYALQGQTTAVSIRSVIANEGLSGMDEFLEKHGDETAMIDWRNSFGYGYDFENNPWKAGDGTPVGAGFTLAATKGDVVETPLKVKDMMEFFKTAAMAYNNADEATADKWSYDELFINWTYPENISFDTVGLYKSGEYQITIVLEKSLAGFNLLYSLTGNWLVKCDAYDACLKETTTAGGTSYTSTYNTSAETAWSYGPYVVSEYQTDKYIRFVKNENWYGYTDGKHTFVDPDNGKTYDMYQTSEIYCQVVKEAATAKEMFLHGKLMGYGLQQADYAEFGKSEFAHFTPGQATFFFVLNGNMDAIEEREAAKDFDKSKYDLEMLTLNSLHKALNLAYDRQAYCDEFSPAESPAFGLVGNAYIYDVNTGATYRGSDQAKKVLCEVYGVDYTKFETLDAAVATITGYDPAAAKTYFQQAYEEGIEKGYITDNNKDGKADQTIKLTYSLGGSKEASENMQKLLKWLGDKANEAAKGTGLEGKFEFVASAPLGDDWSEQIRAGQKDVVLAGFNGSALNPFGYMQVYVDPNYQYDAKWFDATAETMTMTIDGEELTTSLYYWWGLLNGYTLPIGDKQYNFGEGIADIELRLEIMANLEKTILQVYNLLPFSEDGSYALLSQQVYYVIEDYNPVLGRGGIAYLRYNYDDAEWADYVNAGSLKY